MRKLFIPLVVIALAAACFAAGPTVSAKYERNVNFIENVKVGDVVLKAGEYTVTHQMEGDNHIMIFEQHNQQVAKVKCTIEDLKVKNGRTEQYFKIVNGERVLVGLAFQGDSIRHNF